MKNRKWGGVLSRMAVAGLCLLLSGAPAARASDYSNPLFAYTHLLPSPLTLPAGRLVLGTVAAYGIFDSVQVGTNLLRDAYQIWNAEIRANFIDYPEFSLGASVGFQSYNYHNINTANPDLQVNSYLPGLVAGIEILPTVATFVGGNFSITSTNLVTEGISTSGYVQGAGTEWDIAWAYNPPKKRGGLGNVLAAGATYDFSYKVYGFGISHYWRTFRLGIHYYPNATDYKVLPIIAGGAVVDF